MKRNFGSISFLITWLSVLSLSGVISCRQITGRVSTPTYAPRNAWLAEWLENQVCQPPCFLGITPGLTTITETVQILSNRADVRITRGPVVTMDGKSKELSWDFKTATQYDGSRMVTDDTGENILFFVVAPGTDQSLSLSDVISSYGTPDLVYLSDCREGRCVIQFIYMNMGMFVESFLHSEIDKEYKRSVEISPDIRIGKILFFPIGEEGYRKAFPFEANGLERSLEWNGYTVYKEK